MTDLSKLAIYIEQVNDRLWFAASSAAPYFCFEAESEDAVVEKVRRSLLFYSRASARGQAAIRPLM